MIISINAQAGQGIFENIVIRSINGAIVFIRQDYQLVDENEGEIKNAPEKEYWERNYYLAVRIGDDSFLISGETVRPWIKSHFLKMTASSLLFLQPQYEVLVERNLK